MMQKLKYCFVLFVSCAGLVQLRAWLWWTGEERELSVFERRRGAVYRIPSLTWLPGAAGNGTDGRLLAFAEQREDEDDVSNTTIVLRTSDDAGQTWSAQRALFNASLVGLPRAEVVIGNPTSVFDRIARRVVLLFCVQLAGDKEEQISSGEGKGSRWVFTSSSDDGGATWSHPENITTSVKKSTWSWYATGPGAAIQMFAQPYFGRLVAPCNHVDVKKDMRKRSHLIYSDDGGRTWQLGASMSTGTNECAVAELGNGSLLVNSRDFGGAGERLLHIAREGGSACDHATLFRANLREPGKHGCQASMVTYMPPSGRQTFVFSNPDHAERKNLTLKVSQTNGRTWSNALVVHAGPAAYSAMAVLPSAYPFWQSEDSFRVALLFECGKKDKHERIAMAVLSAGELLR